MLPNLGSLGKVSQRERPFFEILELAYANEDSEGSRVLDWSLWVAEFTDRNMK